MTKTATKPIPSPLKWHGGKGAFHGKLAQWIISLMPPHLHYVEPFAGGLSVLLAKDPEGVSEVVNDKHAELTNFWNVLANADDFDQFARTMQAIPFSEQAYADAKTYAKEFPHSGNRHNRAVSFFVQCRQSMSGRMKDFAPLTRNRIRRGMNEQASAWLTTVDGLPIVHDRLSRVVVLNRDALSVIRQQDGENTCAYLDPPYVHETRGSTGEYEHEMTLQQHADLLVTLGGRVVGCAVEGFAGVQRQDWWAKSEPITGKFLLSGYHSLMYGRAAASCGWPCHEFPIVNNASKADKKETKVECVWTNF